MSAPNQMQSIRNILLCVLVFFVWAYFISILSGIVIAALLYMLLRYRNRVKELETSSRPSAAGQSEVPPSSEP